MNVDCHLSVCTCSLLLSLDLFSAQCKYNCYFPFMYLHAYAHVDLQSCTLPTRPFAFLPPFFCPHAVQCRVQDDASQSGLNYYIHNYIHSCIGIGSGCLIGLGWIGDWNFHLIFCLINWFSVKSWLGHFVQSRKSLQST